MVAVEQAPTVRAPVREPARSLVCRVGCITPLVDDQAFAHHNGGLCFDGDHIHVAASSVRD